MRFTPLFVLLFLAIAAYGQQERVAILNTVDDRDSVGVSDLVYLTNRLRETAVKVLPKQRYGVMTTESIIAFLGSQENARRVCNESSCLAEVGRKVSADYVAQARVGRFGNQLSINFQLYNVKTGNLMDSFTGDSKDIFGLRDIIDENAPVLFKQMIDESKPQKNEPEVEKPKLVKPEEKLEIELPEFAKIEPVKPEPEKPKVEEPKVEKSLFRTSFWIALGLDVVGIVVIFAGVVKNQEMNEAIERGYLPEYYNDARKEFENNQSSRNTLYIIGGAILASGIGVHIWF